MAARTTIALLSATGRRLSRSMATASTIAPREVTERHKLTIDGYAASKKLPKGRVWQSPIFKAAGYTWRIRYGPYGESASTMDGEYISMKLEVDHGACPGHIDPVEFKFSLLDASANPVPEFTRATTEVCSFNGESRRIGFDDFIRRKDLEASGCLNDDRFAVRCDITAIKCLNLSEPSPPARVVVPPSDLREHLNDLLRKKEGTDVTVDVGGEATFDAHGWLLAARSPVFKAELLASTKEKSGGRRIQVQGVDPKVFKAMLHYMYTDALPETAAAEQDAVAMAQGLLAAAHRYKLERLKLMCEERLCARIAVGTVAGTLAVAERHGCRALKAACMEFMASPEKVKAVMETEGFEKIKAECPAVLMEIMMKQMATKT
ncbi:hypothetical protein ACP70R_032298 [Stipagrostis hirtigluma subsp. patula]